MPIRVSFDSNAWETIFGPDHRNYQLIHTALAEQKLVGFICASSFRIEAIRKCDRPSYFAQPYLGMRMEGIEVREGRPYIKMSFGPEDKRHPGLPATQAEKLQKALAAGVKLMRGLNWMGLPSPMEAADPALFVEETAAQQHYREQRQIDVSAQIDTRGVGKAAFDAVDGWNVSSTGVGDQKKFHKACAEWADGELVAAHVAYQNDILCTNDMAKAAGASIFNSVNRKWLTRSFGVSFANLPELVTALT